MGEDGGRPSVCSWGPPHKNNLGLDGYRLSPCDGSVHISKNSYRNKNNFASLQLVFSWLLVFVLVITQEMKAKILW